MNKKYLFGLIVLIIIIVGLYYLSKSNKRVLQETQVTKEQISSPPNYESISGTVSNIDNLLIDIKDPLGKGYTANLTLQTKYIKIPVPALLVENPDMNKESPSDINQIQQGDNVSLLFAADSNDVNTLYLYSNNPADFQ
ncbi:hypothetical protein HYT02_03425 [Candidatus Gottesmanbacteria bacterium]|nr:hypothetical protein [Candidatus Gottesmanbacteria bacterium]